MSALISLALAIAVPLTSSAADCPTLARTAASNARAISPDNASRTVTGQGRLQFYTAPDLACKWDGKFVVPGDALVARREVDGFVEVAFIGAKKSDTSLTAWVDPARLQAREGAASACLPYQPASAAVAGTLSRETFPGKPNFKSIEQGDEPETFWYLNLAESQCTLAPADSHLESLIDVRKVQLLIEPNQAATLAPLLGNTVYLTGKLIPAFTAHHHAPLLMQVIAIK